MHHCTAIIYIFQDVFTPRAWLGLDLANNSDEHAKDVRICKQLWRPSSQFLSGSPLKCSGTRGEVPRILRRGTGELLDSHSTSIRNSNSGGLSHRLLSPSANDDNSKSRNPLLKTSASFSQLKSATNRNFTAKFFFPTFLSHSLPFNVKSEVPQ